MLKLTENLLSSLKKKAFTVTNDRGSEFNLPVPGIKTFHCDPQTPQQRGTVENTIGLIRQYIKNSTDLNEFSEQNIQEVENRLNLRPRKCLDYLTPYESFFKTSVALVT